MSGQGFAPTGAFIGVGEIAFTPLPKITVDKKICLKKKHSKGSSKFRLRAAVKLFPGLDFKYLMQKL